MEKTERLPDFVLADFFGKSLVYVEENQQQKAPESVKQKKWYLGNYEKKIVVLVNDESNVYLNDEDLNFLTTILNACKLNLAHIALINFYSDNIDFARLKKELQPSFLISFGIDALKLDLPFTMPLYQVQQYDKCQIITTPLLNELNKQTQLSKNEKAKLWKSLQKMFDIGK